MCMVDSHTPFLTALNVVCVCVCVFVCGSCNYIPIITCVLLVFPVVCN